MVQYPIRYPQTDPPQSPRLTMPTMYDLPSESVEPWFARRVHWLQPELLRQTFHPPNYPGDRIFVGSDLNLYYDPHHPQWYKRPDWFAVVDGLRLYEGQELRLSYVIWQEGVTPLIAIELTSPGTEAEDLGNTLRDANQPPTKWQVYEQILGIPYYAIFNRYTETFQMYRLEAKKYKPVVPDNRGIWLPEAQMGLGFWSGKFQGIERKWLRWYNKDGEWISTPAELAVEQKRLAEEQKQLAEIEKQRAEEQKQLAEIEKRRAEEQKQLAEIEKRRAEEQKQLAESEKQRADLAESQLEQGRLQRQRLADRLRALGIDPENDG